MKPGEKPIALYRFREKLGSVTHDILVRNDYDESGSFDLIVPKNKYFMMGDNRDNSGDSRIWGICARKLFNWACSVCTFELG